MKKEKKKEGIRADKSFFSEWNGTRGDPYLAVVSLSAACSASFRRGVLVLYDACFIARKPTDIRIMCSHPRRRSSPPSKAIRNRYGGRRRRRIVETFSSARTDLDPCRNSRLVFSRWGCLETGGNGFVDRKISGDKKKEKKKKNRETGRIEGIALNIMLRLWQRRWWRCKVRKKH